MRTLDRWVLTRFARTYLAFATSVLVVFVVTDGLNKLGRFVEEAGSTGSLARVVFDYYLALLPEIYYMLAPFVTLIAGLWVVFELRRNNELVPLMSAGLPPLRVVAPIFLAAIFLAGLMFADREWVIPSPGLAEQRKKHTKLERQNYLIPNPIPDRAGAVLSTRFWEPKKQQLDEARYTFLDERGRESITAIASTAVFYRDPPREDGGPGEKGWLFRDGVLVRSQQAPDGEPYRIERIPESGLRIEMDVEPLDVDSAIIEIGYLSTEQMERQYARMPMFKHLGVQLAKRFSYPCASVLLLLLGLPFVLRGDKTEAALGVLACIAICALFFLATAFCEDMGARGAASPGLAAWLPNVVFGLPGLFVFARAAR